MTKKSTTPTVHVRTRAEWRAWLQAHHDSVAEIWLVFDKRHTGQPAIPYEDAVEEALCFGWVDSLIKRLDESRYARKFTPRKPDAKWSSINKRRWERMQAQGLLTEAGKQRPPAATTTDAAPRPPRDRDTPPYIARAFKANRAAWAFFETLAPSHRWHYVVWIDSAKRPETREKRIREAIRRLAAGETLGLK
jgi:uncharacterized protein YdeI (YjbR/CyaY-like superfamily)